MPFFTLRCIPTNQFPMGKKLSIVCWCVFLISKKSGEFEIDLERKKKQQISIPNASRSSIKPCVTIMAPSHACTEHKAKPQLVISIHHLAWWFSKRGSSLRPISKTEQLNTAKNHIAVSHRYIKYKMLTSWSFCHCTREEKPSWKGCHRCDKSKKQKKNYVNIHRENQWDKTL